MAPGSRPPAGLGIGKECLALGSAVGLAPRHWRAELVAVTHGDRPLRVRFLADADDPDGLLLPSPRVQSLPRLHVLPMPFHALATGGAAASGVTAGHARADRNSRCRKRRKLVESEALARREEEEAENSARDSASGEDDGGAASESEEADEPSLDSSGRRMRGDTRHSGREPMSAAVDLATAVASRTRTVGIRSVVKLHKRLVAAPSSVPTYAQVFVTSTPLLTAAERGWIVETADRVGWGSDSNNDPYIQAGGRITLGNTRMQRRGSPDAPNGGLTPDELALLRMGFVLYNAAADLLARAYGVTARRLPEWAPGQAGVNVNAWKKSVVHNMSLLRYTAEHPSLGVHRDASHFAFVLPLAHDAAGGGGTLFRSIGTAKDAHVRQPLGCLGLHCSKAAHGSVPITPHRRKGAPCSRVVLVGFVHVESMPRSSSPNLPMSLQGDLDALAALCGT